MGELITPSEVANLAVSGDIIGMTIRVTYSSGENSKYPVVFHFTGYSYPYNSSKYIDYILQNRNTEAYYLPQPFTYHLMDFVNSWNDREHYDYEENIESVEVLPEGEGFVISTWEV